MYYNNYRFEVRRSNYVLPFEFTSAMVDYIFSIMEKIDKLNNYTNFNISLRKNNRICSIHSSLAIETNSLSLNQIKNVIDGKIVVGSQKEIQEVKMHIEFF